MGKLMDQFRAALAKDKKAKHLLEEAQADVFYSTGFTGVDYLNGTKIHVNGNGINMVYNAVGIIDGSSSTIISRPKTGKSTLLVQIAGNILRAFPSADCFIDDIESSLPQTRKEFLLGLPEEELKKRVHIRNTGITTESVYTQIKYIHDIKVENRSDYLYNTGFYDIFGNEIVKMIPTVYIIDSFAMLMPEDIQIDEEVGNNMDGSQSAKKNSQLVKKISQLLKDANIILFTINHIQDDINMSFIPKAAQISGLKQGERLPGGKAAMYLASNMFRLDDKGTLKESEGLGIRGNVVELSLVKTRTNADRRSIPLIFDKTVGAFDNILSLFYFLKTQGCVGGAGKSMYLENAPDIKFSQKEFKEELLRNTDLQAAFTDMVRQNLEPLLADTALQDMGESIFNINKALQSF